MFLSPLSMAFLGLLDNPWLLLVVLAVSAIINWLAKRKEVAGEDGEDGEDGAPPPRAPVPPPLPGRRDEPAWDTWPGAGGELVQEPPVLRFPDLVPALVPAPSSSIDRGPGREEVKRAAPAGVADLERRPVLPKAPAARRGAWRNPEFARRAYQASVVFGPPRGFDPGPRPGSF